MFDVSHGEQFRTSIRSVRSPRQSLAIDTVFSRSGSANDFGMRHISEETSQRSITENPQCAIRKCQDVLGPSLFRQQHQQTLGRSRWTCTHGQVGGPPALSQMSWHRPPLHSSVHLVRGHRGTMLPHGGKWFHGNKEDISGGLRSVLPVILPLTLVAAFRHHAPALLLAIVPQPALKTTIRPRDASVSPLRQYRKNQTLHILTYPKNTTVKIKKRKRSTQSSQTTLTHRCACTQHKTSPTPRLVEDQTFLLGTKQWNRMLLADLRWSNRTVLTKIVRHQT